MTQLEAPPNAPAAIMLNVAMGAVAAEAAATVRAGVEGCRFSPEDFVCERIAILLLREGMCACVRVWVRARAKGKGQTAHIRVPGSPENRLVAHAPSQFELS